MPAAAARPADATSIFNHALKACNIPNAFDRHLHFEGKTLVRQPSPLLKAIPTSLEQYKRVIVISLGKAGLTMLNALLDRLPPRMLYRGVCSAPELPKKHSWRIRYFAGGHPLPNEGSFAAAREALKPVVDRLAILFDMTSTLSCWAPIPVAPILNALMTYSF